MQIRPLMAVMLAAGAILLAGCGYDPNAIGNMPGPVQQVLDTPTLSGNNIAVNILNVTGNQGLIGRGTIPGDYSYGPVENAGTNTWYVDFEVPIDLNGIATNMGYQPQISTSAVAPNNGITSSTVSEEDYVNILPLPNLAFDRLYFDPNTKQATFSFQLNANGTIMDQSWDAVAVNS